MSAYNFCQLIGDHFGKFYEDATITRIDNIQMPVYYNGSDYISLHPKDNECEVSYIRELQSSQIEYKDLGGCVKKANVIDIFRFVVWSNKPFNNFAKLQRFTSLLEPLNVEILNVVNNIEQIYNQETGKGKHVRLKNVGYLAIDFKVKKRIDTCNINEC